jgi:hypothetical protein
MDNKAWPFVITRNQTLDYRTLIAPQFLLENGTVGVLIREADAGGDHPWAPTWREVHDRRVGDLTLLFRSVAATGGLVGGGNDRPLRDQAGRRIFMIEGLVVESRNPNREAVESHLDRVHELAVQAYQRLWGSTDIRHPATPSDPLPLPTTRPQRWLQPAWGGRRASPQPDRRKRAILVGLVLLLVVAGASIAILRSRG